MDGVSAVILTGGLQAADFIISDEEKACAEITPSQGTDFSVSSELPEFIEVLFKPALCWVWDAVSRAGIERVCVAAPEGFAEAARPLLPDAVFTDAAGAREFIASARGDVLLARGDTPLLSSDQIAASLKAHRASGAAATFFESERIIRSLQTRRAGWLKADRLKTLAGPAPDNGKTAVFTLPAEALAAAENSAALFRLNAAARKTQLEKLLDAGVILLDDSVLVGPDCEIAAGATILPGSILRGKTKIGAHCVIGPNALVEDCVFGESITFNASQAYRSQIGDGCTIGPFAHIRPNTVLAGKVHVGDFVELKNSAVGTGSKVPHLTYVGDSDVGAHVNFGCGCVVSNYDGVKKYRTAVGDDAFIGCNTNLVAPVKVGDGAYTAAGSTITRDVPAGALAVARERQQNIEGWAERKRPKK